jgi:hypothetical protein
VAVVVVVVTNSFDDDDDADSKELKRELILEGVAD